MAWGITTLLVYFPKIFQKIFYNYKPNNIFECPAIFLADTFSVSVFITPCITRTVSFFFLKTEWPCIVIDSLWIKPTDALSSSFTGITTLHVSWSLSAHHQDGQKACRKYTYLYTSIFNINTLTHTNDPYLLKIFHHKMYQCRCTAKKLLMMGRKTARNM
jgi:hypothetical protein